jgi:hypothetical protein
VARAAAYVFGYGSLAAAAAALATRRAPVRDGDPRGYVTELRGHERWWGVAMDNRQAIAGYKRYVDAAGEAPPVHVCFLDLRPVAAGRGSAPGVNGVCTPITSRALAALDARERNYERVDVTPLVAHAAATVWAYIGSDAGRARAQAGRDAGSAVVAHEYCGLVERGFARLGPREMERYRATTAPPGVPVVALTREELPPSRRPRLRLRRARSSG